MTQLVQLPDPGNTQDIMADAYKLWEVMVYLIESGEVIYISQYRTHTNYTPITHFTDTHTFTMFKSIKT